MMIAADENDEIFNQLRSLGVHAGTIEGAQSSPVDRVVQSPSFAHKSLSLDLLQKTLWTTTPPNNMTVH